MSTYLTTSRLRLQPATIGANGKGKSKASTEAVDYQGSIALINASESAGIKNFEILNGDDGRVVSSVDWARTFNGMAVQSDNF